ncbi:MAG: hypothetical protein V1866_03050 [archaeon]
MGFNRIQFGIMVGYYVGAGMPSLETEIGSAKHTVKKNKGKKAGLDILIETPSIGAFNLTSRVDAATGKNYVDEFHFIAGPFDYLVYSDSRVRPSATTSSPLSWKLVSKENTYRISVTYAPKGTINLYYKPNAAGNTVLQTASAVNKAGRKIFAYRRS